MNATPPATKKHLSPDQEARIRRRSSAMGAWLVFHAWVVILAAATLFVLMPNPLTFLLAVVVIGSRQLGLAILMHDAAHRALFAGPRVNDWVGRWLCGNPVGASLAKYRPYHLQHHRHTQQAGDPDLSLSAPFPISRASFRRKVIRDLVGLTGLQRRREQFMGAFGDAQGWQARAARLWAAERGFFVGNLLLLALATAAGVWWVYFALWMLPMLTWYQFVSRVRNIAEHAVIPDNDDALRNTRTTLANPLVRAIFAPYWVNYHLEHHLFAYAPCWQLPRAHRMLVDLGLRDRMEVERGYLRVLRRATSRGTDDRTTRTRSRGSLI